jgi:endoglucanase
LSRWLLFFLAVTPSVQAQYLRGANVSGAEFGQSNLPGIYDRDYTFSSEMTYRYFGARNLSLIRLPLQWERLQPVLRAPLESGYLNLLKTTVAWAKGNGIQLIPEIHNFARYSITENGKLTPYIIDATPKVTSDDFADLWVRLSNEFSGEPTVYAYDLMNEPHDMKGWKTISQFAVTAIRNNGDSKLIMVPGDSWSSANRWISVHGPSGWINDPANNFMYEAHVYFDSDESGTYSKTYDAELKANPALPTIGSTRVSHFISWCRDNNVRGYLGEFGIPDSDPRWFSVLDDFLKAIDAAGMHGTIWAAGEWWINTHYPLSVQPTNNFMIDRPQTTVLLGHLAPGLFTSVSAAGNTGSTFAPEQYMAGYGAGVNEGATVELTRSDGLTVNAPIVFAEPGQINYLIPAGTPLGRTRVAVRLNGAVVGTGAYALERVAPTLFTFDGSASGTAAAVVLRIKAVGTLVNELTNHPISFGDPSDRLFLSLYGTGFRNALAPESASLRVGAEKLAITYIGLDQINAELPRALTGAGKQTVTFTIDGKTANPVTLTFTELQP